MVNRYILRNLIFTLLFGGVMLWGMLSSNKDPNQVLPIIGLALFITLIIALVGFTMGAVESASHGVPIRNQAPRYAPRFQPAPVRLADYDDDEEDYVDDEDEDY